MYTLVSHLIVIETAVIIETTLPGLSGRETTKKATPAAPELFMFWSGIYREILPHHPIENKPYVDSNGKEREDIFVIFLVCAKLSVSSLCL